MSPKEAFAKILQNPDFIDCSDFPQLAIDLRYGTTNNLLGKDIYEGFQRVILHKIAAAKFKKACEILGKKYPGLSFLVYDALRPSSAQWAFWKLVEGTPQQKYFADPKRGSIHSYGFALDIGLADQHGKEVDMGTGFDDLNELAEPRREDEFLAAGKLTVEQVKNRKILRDTLVAAGFGTIEHEWWHFDALPPADVRGKFLLVE